MIKTLKPEVDMGSKIGRTKTRTRSGRGRSREGEPNSNAGHRPKRDERGKRRYAIDIGGERQPGHIWAHTAADAIERWWRERCTKAQLVVVQDSEVTATLLM